MIKSISESVKGCGCKVNKRLVISFSAGTVILLLLLVLWKGNFQKDNLPVNVNNSKSITTVSTSLGVSGTDEMQIYSPYGIAYSEQLNALIIAAPDNHQILSMDLDTLSIKVLAGRTEGFDRFGLPGGGLVDGNLTEAMFNYPFDVTVSKHGTIFIADSGNSAIRQINDGVVSTVAGGLEQGYEDGQGIDAKFHHPRAIALDAEENIFVSDSLNNLIRKIDREGNVSTYAGDINDSSLLNEPSGLAFNTKGTLFVLDSANHKVKQITESGHIKTVTGIDLPYDETSGYPIGDYVDGNHDIAAFNFPMGIAFKNSEDFYIADTYNHTIRLVTSDNVTTIAGSGVAGESLTGDKFKINFDAPTNSLSVKNKLYIADRYNNRIVIIDEDS